MASLSPVQAPEAGNLARWSDPPVGSPWALAHRVQPWTRGRRIAFLTSARDWRGSGNVFASIGNGLAARGDSVMALVAHEDVGGGFRARGLEVQTLPIHHTRLRGVRALRRALRELGTELLFTDMRRDVRLGAFASLGLPIAVVYCISTPHPPRDLLTRLAFRRVQLTVFLTDLLAQRALIEAPFMRRASFRVIPNGVDCALFRPAPNAGKEFRTRHRLGNGPVLVGVGALAVEKRWDLLLESVAALPCPRPSLVLCGSGPLRGTLQAIARRLDLDVRLVGTLESAQLVGAYNAATCVVHAGPEACSLALMEALACGRPVLAADSGGTKEVLGVAGVLSPPADPRAFAALLRELLRDAALRDALGAAARRRALDRFTLDAMVRAYVHLVESLAWRA